MKYGTLSQQMAKNGVKLRTWAKAKGLSKKDIALLNQISHRLIKGKRGRAKELKEMLEKDGFEVV
ncbi:hypothetical protein [Helicobacter pullorum]|uniref:hypothetical protein n=1 Tax=Helicobacter pullorum TaxID=35818 RepID=UPI0006BB20C0|nr:hypothetical protein [Helicobacter pullorum]KPH54104.1 hypothetical protein HPU229313_08395 [Helicobacter pullorum]